MALFLVAALASCGGGSGSANSNGIDNALDSTEAAENILNGANVTVDSLAVEVSPTTLQIGEVATATAWARLSDGTRVEVTAAVTWQLTPAGIVDVDSNAARVTLSAASAGNVSLTATLSGSTQLAVVSAPQEIEVLPNTPPALELRFNAGGNAIDVAGTTFSADRLAAPGVAGFTGGTLYSNSVAVAGTTAPELYQTLRYGDFGFRAPLPNGAYEVRLHFAEIVPNFGPTFRIFDTTLEGQVVESDLDIAAEFGANVAVIRTHFVEVVDGVLDLAWSPTVNNAIICAVEISSLAQLPPSAPIELAIQPGELLVDLGNTTTVDLIADYNVGPDQVVTSAAQWSTDNPTILQLTSAGSFQPLAYGTANLTASFGGLSVTVAVEVADLDVPVSFGASMHPWNAKLGGVVWLPTRASAARHASAFAEYPGNVLVCIKPDERSFGYRFDTNFWETSTNNYGWFNWDGSDEGEPPTLDEFFQIYGTANAEFILTLPMPRVLSSTPSGGQGFLWQTPEYYAAQCQYLFGTADAPASYANLSESIDFFGAPTDFNWANLRARRGHVEPYPCEALLLAGEPYFGEGWDEGADYGVRAELYRQLLRARGVDLPYGVHIHYHSATEHDWFDPMFDALSDTDPPSYLDLFHFYTLPASPEWERAYAVSTKAEGFTFWWETPAQWDSDYSQFLWTFDSTREALTRRGLDPNAYQLGFSEHGIRLETPFQFNDMQGGLHWALWLTEMMKRNATWDSMWNLGAEGFATAQLQSVSGNLTRTPAFYVYRMAQELLGLDVLETNFTPLTGETTSQAVWGNNSPATFPWIVVQGFDDPATGWRHLFVVNHHASATFTLTGLNGWSIEAWEELRGDFYTSENPLGAATPEALQPQLLPKSPDAPLEISPISVVRIVLRP